MEREKGPKFCPCGKQAIDFGDGKLKCPQHFTEGEDLVDEGVKAAEGRFVEADEGTNKGATEFAVREVDMSDKGAELAKEPTQENRALEGVEEFVGTSEDATAKADLGKTRTAGNEPMDVKPGAQTKAADERAGVTEDQREAADVATAAPSLESAKDVAKADAKAAEKRDKDA